MKREDLPRRRRRGARQLQHFHGSADQLRHMADWLLDYRRRGQDDDCQALNPLDGSGRGTLGTPMLNRPKNKRRLRSSSLRLRGRNRSGPYDTNGALCFFRDRSPRRH